MRRSTSAARAACAFTLVELMIVMAIIATLAFMAVPRFNNALAPRRAEMAAGRIAADLDYARRHARATSSAIVVQFDASRSTYTLIGVTHPDHPAQAYAVALTDEPYRATIGTFDVGGDTNIVFDAWGDADARASISVVTGNIEYLISVERYAPHASVSRTR